MFEPIQPRTGFAGNLITETVTVEADPDYEVLETAPKQDTGDSIEGAQVIVAGGRGIKEEADLDSLKELAALLDGKLAASRPLVDNGWLPHEKQIGQSGTAVKPKYIFNIAISGSVQYQVGMQNAAQAITVSCSPLVFNNETIAIPAIIYALMMNVLLLIYVGIVKRRN